MFFSIVVICIAGFIAYFIASQGFFSAILHLGCVIAAGALAFGLWEPVVYLLSNKINSPKLIDMIWGISLLVIFSLSLFILRIFSDKICIANTQLSGTQNFIGGGIAGLASGIIASGIIVIGIQFIQGPSKLLGYSGWVSESGGKLVKAGGSDGKLMFPTDEWTAWFYSTASVGSMAVYEPLAIWQPDLAQQASLYRKSFENGASRMGIKPGDVNVTEVIRVQPNNIADYLRNVDYVRGIDTNTQTVNNNADIYILKTSIDTAAWDDASKMRVTKAQVRLVVKYGNKIIPIHPHAFIHRFDTADNLESRWLYDTQDIPAISVGSTARTEISFEFIVPPGATLHHLIFKQARTEIPAVSPIIEPQSYIDRLNTAMVRENKPAPNPGTPEPPAHWQGLAVMVLLLVMTLLTNLKPSKRTHQD